MSSAIVHDVSTLWPQIDSLPAATTFIGGKGEDAAADNGLVVDDPATLEAVGRCLPSNAEQVDRAVRAAADAGPGWAGLTPSERADAISAGAAAIEEAADDLARMLIAEVGKPGFECTGDVRGGVHLLRTFAGLTEEAAAMHDLTGRDGTGTADEVVVHRVPIGPVAVITPWNTPVYLTMNCVGPALAAGCPVVVKPAEAAPLAVTAALRLLASQLPAGVLNIVQGTGAQVGEALTSHPSIRGVSFVGGTVAGRRVLAAAAPTVKKTSLELGGNDPAIVLADAQLDEATLQELVAGCYAVSGQVCFNIKRIYVHRSRHDELVEALTGMVDALRVGPGGDPTVHLGPLTTPGGYDNAKRMLDSARSAGARVHEGGVFTADVDRARGRYIAPTVVTDIAADHELVLEEQFAPIIPIVPFDTDEEVIFEANRTEHGLCSSVWSADPARAVDIASRIEAGNTFINAHRVGASVPLVPFGGVKQSGLGRNHLMHAIAECTEEHAIVRYTRPAEQIPGIAPWTTLRTPLEAR